MTMMEVENKLRSDFKDEIEDCNTYYEMSETATNMGHKELGEYLLEISKDEYTHAKFIHEYLLEHPMNVNMAELEGPDWQALHHRMEPFFR